MTHKRRSLACLVPAVWMAGASFLPVAAAPESQIELLDGALTPEIARQCFEEGRQLCEKDAGRLWGVSLCGPILLADPKTRAVVASEADHEGRLTPQDGVFVGTLPAEETIAGTAKDWAGVRWVMIPWPLPVEQNERRHILAHEMFHRVQSKLGLLEPSPNDATTSHLDTRDGRLWLKLEWRALQTALKTWDRERDQAVSDALTFRAYRRSLFSGATAGELAQETIEGLAEYTGVRLSADSYSAAIERALRNFELAESWPTLTYSFAYVSGAAYGLLLDGVKPDWRSGLRAGDDLGVLLRQSLSISLPQELKTAAQERAEAYAFEELAAAETARAAGTQDNLAKHRRRFVTGPVLIIPIQNMQFQFDPRDIQPLDDFGKVYPKMKMSDTWGILNVTSGALIADDWSKVVVPAPSDPNARPLEGDGWTLELSTGWAVQPAERRGDYIVRHE